MRIHDVKDLTMTALALAVSGDQQQNLIADKIWILRPYNALSDRSHLDEICSNTFKGTNDYLPAMIPKYVADPDCRFIVLANAGKLDDESEFGVPEACLNLRDLGHGVRFLEAVRTRPESRGKGLGNMIISKMLEEVSESSSYEKILSCTVAGNQAMRRIFDKTGFRQVTEITGLNFKVLTKIPGWSVHDKDHRCDQTLVEALNLSNLISDQAKRDVESWQTVKTKVEAEFILNSTAKYNPLWEYGCIPGLFEGIGIDSQRFKISLKNGRVLVLENDLDSPALIVFHRDPRIASLKSNWILSIVGTTSHHLESALYAACSKRIQNLLREDSEDPDDFIGFVLTFCTTMSIRDELAASFPLWDESCVVYGRKLGSFEQT